jgi:flagellin-like protein
MARKGISPLIAVIMLIAFTMIVAGILAGWATQFVTQSRSELQFCSKAQLLIQRAYYEESGTANEGNVTLALFNTGDVDLRGLVVRLTYKNQDIESTKFEDMNISYQDIKTVTLFVNETDNELDQLVVQSLQCRGAQDMIGRYDIQGLGFKTY